MSEKEKKIAEKVAAAVPQMDEFTKGYFLGRVEAMVYEKEMKATDFENAERSGRAGR